MASKEVVKALVTKAAPAGHQLIREGNGVMIYPEKNQVFYNNVQVLNRDLSIAIITDFVYTRAREILAKQNKKAALESNEQYVEKEYSDTEIHSYVVNNAKDNGIKIFEALAATGLRSIRYYQQIPGVQKIIVNDMDPAAVETIKKNISFNELPLDRVVPSEADATNVMYNHRNEKQQFDVIDLDPYGSASIFLDAAVQSVANGGLLCVTCTDMAVLSGKNPEVCFSRYGSVPNKSNYLHEMALRIVLQSIESTAIKYARHIVPIASCSIDFYVRVFVRVYKSPINVKQAMTKLSYVYQCVGCDSFHLQRVGVQSGKAFHAARGPAVGQECVQCQGKFKMAGPIWSDEIHSKGIIGRIRDRIAKTSTSEFPTKDRLHGLLTTISEELENAPLHYTVPGLCKTLHCSSPKMHQIQSALRHAGYDASQFHKVPDAIKTNAPDHVVWDIMRCWVKKHPINAKRKATDTPGMRILNQEPKLEANFSYKSSSLSMAKDTKTKALRFPPNPEPNWGPKARATGYGATKAVDAKVDLDEEPQQKRPKTSSD